MFFNVRKMFPCSDQREAKTEKPDEKEKLIMPRYEIMMYSSIHRILITAVSITGITNVNLFILIGLVTGLSSLFFVGLLYNDMDQNLRL